MAPHAPSVSTASPSTVLSCRHCGWPIKDKKDMLLLRRRDWIPENPSVAILHGSCAEAFEHKEGGTWRRYSMDSQEAIWLLPLR